jgi:hypothetical protein
MLHPTTPILLWYRLARPLHVRLHLESRGDIRLHRNMQAAPAPFLRAIAPSRDGLVVAVACLCTWYWLADRSRRLVPS